MPSAMKKTGGPLVGVVDVGTRTVRFVVRKKKTKRESLSLVKRRSGPDALIIIFALQFSAALAKYLLKFAYRRDKCNEKAQRGRRRLCATTYVRGINCGLEIPLGRRIHAFTRRRNKTVD